MNIADNLENAAKTVLTEATKVADQARRKAGELTHDNRDKIESALHKATEFVDDKTGGKFHDQIDKVKDMAAKGVEFVEDKMHPDTVEGEVKDAMDEMKTDYDIAPTHGIDGDPLDALKKD